MEYHCFAAVSTKSREMLLPVMFPVLRLPVRSLSFVKMRCGSE